MSRRKIELDRSPTLHSGARLGSKAEVKRFAWMSASPRKRTAGKVEQRREVDVDQSVTIAEAGQPVSCAMHYCQCSGSAPGRATILNGAAPVMTIAFETRPDKRSR